MTTTMDGSLGGAYGGHGPEIMGVSWALMGITTILILIRVYTRFFANQQSSLYGGVWSLLWVVLAWVSKK